MKKLILIIFLTVLAQDIIADSLIISEKAILIEKINISTSGDESPLKMASDDLKKMVVF